MKLIKELGAGFTKRAFLYEKEDGEKVVVLKPINKSRRRWFSWQTSQESNITQKLPPMRCNVRTLRVRKVKGEWEVIGNFVEGEPLSRRLYESLDPQKQAQLITDFADFLINLNLMNISKLDERYADEVDKITLPHILGGIYFKLYCWKRHFLSLNKPWKNPYNNRKYVISKKLNYERCQCTPREIEQIEKVLRAVDARPDIFSYIGVCYHDFKDLNFLYDRKTARLGALDLCCLYKHSIYYQFAAIYTWIGKNFTQALVHRYNELAKERDVHLPKCKAYPLVVEFRMVQHLAVLRSFLDLPPWADPLRDELTQLLDDLY